MTKTNVLCISHHLLNTVKMCFRLRRLDHVPVSSTVTVGWVTNTAPVQLIAAFICCHQRSIIFIFLIKNHQSLISLCIIQPFEAASFFIPSDSFNRSPIHSFHLNVVFIIATSIVHSFLYSHFY